MTALFIVLGVLVYAVGSTLTFGFFARRVPTAGKYYNSAADRYENAVFAAIAWPLTALFIIPAKLYLERIRRVEAAERKRVEEEKELLRIAEEELEQEDRVDRVLRRIK